jgi:hypothetical protein
LPAWALPHEILDSAPQSARAACVVTAQPRCHTRTPCATWQRRVPTPGSAPSSRVRTSSGRRGNELCHVLSAVRRATFGSCQRATTGRAGSRCCRLTPHCRCPRGMLRRGKHSYLDCTRTRTPSPGSAPSDVHLSAWPRTVGSQGPCKARVPFQARSQQLHAHLAHAEARGVSAGARLPIHHDMHRQREQQGWTCAPWRLAVAAGFLGTAP